MDSLFALVSWQVWKECNTCRFREAWSSMNELLQVIRAEADRWIEAGAKGLSALAQAQA
jgi:hypothetical protein